MEAQEIQEFRFLKSVAVNTGPWRAVGRKRDTAAASRPTDRHRIRACALARSSQGRTGRDDFAPAVLLLQARFVYTANPRIAFMIFIVHICIMNILCACIMNIMKAIQIYLYLKTKRNNLIYSLKPLVRCLALEPFPPTPTICLFPFNQYCSVTISPHIACTVSTQWICF